MSSSIRLVLPVTRQGRSLPFVWLGQLLERDAAPAGPPQRFSALILACASGMAAVGVERLLGCAEHVVRPLPARAGRAPAVLAALLDAEGRPTLVLEPAELVAAARAGRFSDPAPAPAERPPVLVVDDSLTTRMLERSILEAAGYSVELACSALEALEKTAAKRYGAFVVDVEMPGMDGYEFVRLTRQPAPAVPAVLVTSRSSEQDRRRGMECGAHAYIVKSEFDEGRLVQTLGELLP